MEVIDDCVFPDKIAMKKILKWYEKIRKEGLLYEFQYLNVPIKKSKKWLRKSGVNKKEE